MLTWTQMRWWMAAPALVLIRVFWCELHGAATGMQLVGLDVSLPWALQASAGWILAGALLGLYGTRLLGSGFGNRHPIASRALLGAGVLPLTLGCETWLLSGDTRLTLWLYERLPLHATFVALLFGGYLFINRTRTSDPAPPEASMLDVMTGTGRTRVRIDEIECLEADRNYVNVHTPQRSYLLRQTLASLEASLNSETFRRIHRSIIVNRAMIRERRRGGVLVLNSGRTVRISRAFADRLN